MPHILTNGWADQLELADRRGSAGLSNPFSIPPTPMSFSLSNSPLPLHVFLDVFQPH